MESKLIIGTAQFGMAYGINNVGGQPTAQTIAEMLNLAFSKGIVLLDSAEAYGTSHEQIGSYHALSPNRFKVITKFSPSRKDLPLDIYKRVIADCGQLNVETLEAYMLHSYHDYEAHIHDFSSAFRQLKQEAKIKNVGVSVYTNAEFEKVIEDERVDLIQLPFNVFDNYTRRGELIEKAKQAGKIIHTRSVFLQGLFFMPEAKMPERLKTLVPSIQALNHVSKKNNCSLESLCLQYVLQQAAIEGVLLGMENTSQLQANLEALKHKLLASVLKEVEQITIANAELLNPSTWNA